jgi:ABC transporter substrate binding protein
LVAAESSLDRREIAASGLLPLPIPEFESEQPCSAARQRRGRLRRRAQHSAKMPRVGWLVTGSPTSHRFSLAAFRDGLRALNYIEGENIIVEYRWAEGDVARLSELAKDLVDRKVDIILAGGSLGVQAAKDATSLIPIVGAGVGDLVELGLVTNLARPGVLTGFVSPRKNPHGIGPNYTTASSRDMAIFFSPAASRRLPAPTRGLPLNLRNLAWNCGRWACSLHTA